MTIWSLKTGKKDTYNLNITSGVKTYFDRSTKYIHTYQTQIMKSQYNFEFLRKQIILKEFSSKVVMTDIFIIDLLLHVSSLLF